MGRKHSEETKKKIGKANSIALFGHTPWNKGLNKYNNESMKQFSEKLKGKGNHRYGVKVNEKTIELRRLKMFGHEVSETTREKIGKAHKGKIVSDETRKRISESGKGKTPWNKNKGYLISNESRQKMSLSQKKRFIDNPKNKGIIFSEEHKAKLKEARTKQVFPLKDTKIEIKIQNILSQLHLEFATHKYISEITHKYQCDIFIPVQEGINQKTIIECDGCYWHGCPVCNFKKPDWIIKRSQIDNLRTKELKEKGFKVIRLWEHEIKKYSTLDLINNFREVLKSDITNQ